MGKRSKFMDLVDCADGYNGFSITRNNSSMGVSE